MIERTYRGVAPHPSITAPLAPVDRWIDHHDEAIRLATFRQSAETRDGQLAPFPTPTNDNAGEPGKGN